MCDWETRYSAACAKGRVGRGTAILRIRLVAVLAASLSLSISAADARSADPCGETRELPLATHWTPDTGYTGSAVPSWQMDQIDAGHYWLPSFNWRLLGNTWDPATDAAYTGAILRAKAKKLPISVTATQWEYALYEKAPWKDLPSDKTALVVTPGGEVLPKVSAFGAIEPWREVGAAWATTDILKKLQELYPDPPYVFLLSNNEANKLHQEDVEKDRNYLQKYGTGRSLEEKRRALGDGYIERYGVMVAGLRGALGPWKDRAIVAGWGGTSVNFGRWMGSRIARGSWKLDWLPNFTLAVPGRLSIVPYIWDGASLQYYIQGPKGDDDFTGYSPNVEVMNMPLQQEDICKIKPRFFFEFSTWYDPRFVDRLRKAGQSVSPGRYKGWLRWGMWIGRPRSVRHFSYSQDNLPDFEPWLRMVMEAVDEIHATPELASFWIKSDLVWNTAVPHPYQIDIPAEYLSTTRWAGLSTSVDPPKPWGYETVFRVWALARVQGVAGNRHWLLYVQSPKGLEPGVKVTVPGWGAATVDATPEGRYYVLDEGSTGVTSVKVR